MSQTAVEWFKELAQEAGYTEQQSTDLLKLISNDKVGAKVNGVLKTAQDDYNAQVGRVRTLEQTAKDAQAKVEAYNAWWTGDSQKPGAYAEYENAIKERDAALAKLAGHGPLTTEESGKFVSKDDLTKMLAERDGRFASVIKEVGRVASRHAAKFHEELDTDALEKLATEKGLTVSQAYDEMVKPRVEALDKEAREKEKKDFADQAVRDALSRHKLPVDPVPQDTAPLYQRFKKEDVPVDMDGDLLAAWHGVK